MTPACCARARAGPPGTFGAARLRTSNLGHIPDQHAQEKEVRELTLPADQYTPKGIPASEVFNSLIYAPDPNIYNMNCKYRMCL